MKIKIEQESKLQKDNYNANSEHSTSTTLFLSGDVMTGRGIDQILPNSGSPTLYESYMNSANGYVELAEDNALSLKW